MAEKLALFLLPIFYQALASPTQGRPIMNLSSVMPSDGINEVLQPVFDHLDSFISSATCDETYGFLPCTTSVLGNIFLIFVYSYFMFLAAKLLSAGSEVLLEILGPGIIGGLFLPVLGAVPDAAIILASGLSGSKETAQSQVSVGMGLMAGSTVMLLTILWASCLVVGKCDIEGSTAIDSKDTKRFSLTGSGVSTDIWTTYAAIIMLISVIPFLIVELQQIFLPTSTSRLAILISLIVSICFVIAYCLYQVFQPFIQNRRIAYVRHKRVMSGILKRLNSRALGRLYTEDGEPDEPVIRRLFNAIDANSDGCLSAKELRALVIGFQFEDTDTNIDDATKRVMKDFDKSKDSSINEEEFVAAISRWLNKAKRSGSATDMCDGMPLTAILLDNFQQRARTQYELLGNENDEAEGIQNPKWNAFKAVLMLLLGTIIAAVASDPLVDAVDNFSTASSIPSFFVSFIILPFATSSEIVSTLTFTSRKKSKTASLAYSEIYGSVTMSNILSLSVFLCLVYFRQLTWNFLAEVLIILIVCFVTGLIASFRTTLPLWLCLVAYALYPLSLLLVYFLDYVLGWS